MSQHLQRVKQFASTKWDELTSTLSVQRQIRGLERQIADLVQERDRIMMDIGAKVYALYGRGKVRNADIIPLCERIGEISKRIETLNARVRELAQPKPKGLLTEPELTDEAELADESVEEPADSESEVKPEEETSEGDRDKDAPAEE